MMKVSNQLWSGLLAASLLLAACAPVQPSAVQPAANNDSQSATGYPVTVTDCGGRETTYTKAPERVLVQQVPILLLDEPTNHLDIHYQLDVLHRVHSLKLTTIAALHDLNLAASWCDRVYVMDRGRIVAGGPPHESLTAECISSVFRVRATAFTHPVTGKHQLLFDRAEGA